MGPSSQPAYVVRGLKPYHVYNFTVTVCTKSGCIASLPSTGQTLSAGKKIKDRDTNTRLLTNAEATVLAGDTTAIRCEVPLLRAVAHGLQQCLGGLRMSKNIHVNTRVQDLPAL